MFLAHLSTVPKGTFVPLPQYQNKKVLVNDGNIKLISNVCPHQGSIISSKPGKGSRVCPYHSWSFDLSGNPISSGRTAYYCKNENPLESTEVYHWNGLLFSTPVDFDVSVDFSNLILKEHRVDRVLASPENIMDLFLDVDHIPAVHKGLYEQIGIDDEDVSWTFYNNGSVQTVQDKALWIAVYPYTMIEWQDGSLFITVAEKVGENLSDVFVFKYGSESSILRWGMNENIWETAWSQDKEQAQRLTFFNDKNLEPAKEHYRKHGLNLR